MKAGPLVLVHVSIVLGAMLYPVDGRHPRDRYREALLS
jgi:hypothetical protein